MPEPASNFLRFPNSAAPPGSSPYYSIRFGARRRHSELALVLAWGDEMRRIASETSDPGVARLKLDWWRGELDRTVAGTAQHPLARDLASMISACSLPIAPFHEHIDAWDRKTRRSPVRTKSQLLADCEAAGGSLAEVIARINGDLEGKHARTARGLGASSSLAERIRDLGADLRRQHCILPGESLRTYGLAPERLLENPGEAGLARLLAELAEDCRRVQRQALAAEARRPPAALGPVLVLAELHLATLGEIERTGFRVIDERLSLTPLRKLWIAWRTGRRLA